MGVWATKRREKSFVEPMEIAETPSDAPTASPGLIGSKLPVLV